MPKQFAVQVLGESVPRSFRWDFETSTLSTDWEVDDPAFAGKKQAEVQITEKNFSENPDYMRFWEATATHRLAFQLCEDEKIPMDEALIKAEQMRMHTNGEPPIAPSAPENPSYNEIGERIAAFNPNVEPEAVTAPAEPQTNPLAGIVITNQQLILSMAFKLLEQYVPEDDPNSGMVELLKAEMEKLDGYEIVI